MNVNVELEAENLILNELADCLYQYPLDIKYKLASAINKIENKYKKIAVELSWLSPENRNFSGYNDKQINLINKYIISYEIYQDRLFEIYRTEA